MYVSEESYFDWVTTLKGHTKIIDRVHISRISASYKMCFSQHFYSPIKLQKKAFNF